jgi:hypothetical protein
VRLFSYVVARDFGFAPNPFHRICTLATCKPRIRSVANVGDWVAGTGTAKRKRSGYLVFAMQVDEAITFEEYWTDLRFQRKKPNLRSSKKQAFGDNIYSRSLGGAWVQADSHHTFEDGSPNPGNVATDTSTNRVLIAHDFVYWGGSGPKIPAQFDICAKRNHRSDFSQELIDAFVAWCRSGGKHGYVAEPLDWVRSP